MKFLKGMIAGKKNEEVTEEQSGLSIEDLQRDLDHSGMEQTLRNPDSAWSEKAAQRPGEIGEPMATSGAPDWDEDVGDAFAAQGGQPVQRTTAPDEVADDDGFDEFDDMFDDEFDELEPEEEAAIKDNALLVEEIRDAIAAVRHIEANPTKTIDPVDPTAKAEKKGSWEQDDVFGRKALARDQLKGLAQGADSERILEETNHKMDDDDEANRRRLAMAHLKAAAAATKADSVLKRVVGRDPATDMEQQVQYREDLANVVRQRGPRSEAISRPLSRPLSRPVSRPYSQAIQPAASPVVTPQAEADLHPEDTAPTPIDMGTRQAPEQQIKAPTLRATEEPAEAPMDVEKLDLKTALERQRAILKAEREALEAEMAGEALVDTEERADAAFKVAEVAETPSSLAEDDSAVEPDDFETSDEFGDASEVEEDDAAAFDAVDEDTEVEDVDEGADARVALEIAEAPSSIEEPETAEDEPFGLEEASTDDEWDEGIDLDADDEAEGDAPVDLTRLDEPVEEAVPVKDDTEMTVRELDLVDEPAPTLAEPTEVADAAVAAPRRAGRVKTRLLGFQSKTPGQDVFEGKAAEGAGPVRFPVGWLVVTRGEGFGHSFSLLSGVSKIGRGEDQAVKLDFGDTAISRDNHAAIAFDEELNQFFLGHGGKSNVVRLNGKPVLSTEELFDGDEIRIGETTLKFIALCGDEFTWAQTEGNGSEHAASA